MIDTLFDCARRFAGAYTVRQWKAETWQNKAIALADFLENQIRESYAMERAREESKKDDKGPNMLSQDWNRFRQGGR